MRKMFSEKQLQNIALEKIENSNLNINGNITANSIIENMSGYSATLNPSSITDHTFTNLYTSAVKNGNKLTLVSFIKINRDVGATNNRIPTVRFTIPTAVGDNLYPYSISGYNNMLDIKSVKAVAGLATISDVTCFIGVVSLQSKE